MNQLTKPPFIVISYQLFCREARVTCVPCFWAYNFDMSTAMEQEHLARLKAELAAIDKWDETYRLEDKAHHPNEEVAHEARQPRGREIMREIQNLESHSELRGAA